MDINGIRTAYHYAYPPNILSYCGPKNYPFYPIVSKNQSFAKKIRTFLSQFETMYPYLYLIASENNIKNPFDIRVVKAYWIGNSLLHQVSMRKFYYHLKDTLQLKKKLSPSDYEKVYGILDFDMLPHHTFHVLNIFIRTGHHAIYHTLSTMDLCRINWGIVTQTPKTSDTNIKNTASLVVKTRPLILDKNHLTLGDWELRVVQIPYYIITRKKIKKNTFVSFHWDTLCDIISREEAQYLSYYTNKAIILFNSRHKI